jgi:hypothetical protein
MSAHETTRRAGTSMPNDAHRGSRTATEQSGIYACHDADSAVGEEQVSWTSVDGPFGRVVAAGAIDDDGSGTSRPLTTMKVTRGRGDGTRD